MDSSQFIEISGARVPWNGPVGYCRRNCRNLSRVGGASVGFRRGGFTLSRRRVCRKPASRTVGGFDQEGRHLLSGSSADGVSTRSSLCRHACLGSEPPVRTTPPSHIAWYVVFDRLVAEGRSRHGQRKIGR